MSAPIVIEVVGQQVPSFKNRKRVTKSGGLITEPKIKTRMDALENAILSALYSESQIIGNETHSECWKRLRIALSGLCDDSIREMPDGAWSTQQVPQGEEGVKIEIMKYERK